MRESFERKHAGNLFTETDYEKLTREARTHSAALVSGSFLAGRNSQAGNFVASPPYQEIDLVEVQGVQTGRIYQIKRRWYDHEAEQWKTNDNMNIQFMDATDLNISFSTGDITVAYWDNQRRMWIPVGGGKSVDPMWCAKICECIIQRADLTCCVWRGSVKRIEEVPLGGWSAATLCDPPATVLPAIVLTECTTDLTDAEGWVRKIGDDVEITWTPNGFTEPITEKLGLYEWCCWGPGLCPDDDKTITVTISHSAGDADPTHQCPEADGIQVELEFRDQTGSEPTNNALCAYSGWYGEFKKAAQIPVRIYLINYAPADNPGGPESEDGWVRPNWLTGEAESFFDEDQNPITEPSSYTLIGDCTILLDSGGEPIEESVTRYYRLSVECAAGELFSPCIQHIYPPGHPIYAALGDDVLSEPDAPIEAMSAAIALEDHQFHEQLKKVCTNDFISKFEALFGDAHSTTTSLGANVPDGIFGGDWAKMHTFIGCFDYPKGSECLLLIEDWDQNWNKYTAHWTWK